MPYLKAGIAVRRRDFIGVIGGAAAWPISALAQQPALPVIGILGAAIPDNVDVARNLAAFRRTGIGRAFDFAAARRRGDRVKRREFITLLSGAAAAWLLAPSRHPRMSAQVSLLGGKRKTSTRSEYFAF
jgi:hypothetical protein